MMYGGLWAQEHVPREAACRTGWISPLVLEGERGGRVENGSIYKGDTPKKIGIPPLKHKQAVLSIPLSTPKIGIPPEALVSLVALTR